MALGRRSVTPPAQPLSKRDKKRNQYLQQQQDLQTDFNEKREHYYRQQLIGLQHDMNLIIQSDPYDSSLLEDAPEEITRLVEEAAANTPYQNELSAHAGRWYSEWVHAVNEAKEQKEIGLIQLAVRTTTQSRYQSMQISDRDTEKPSNAPRAAQVRMRL